MQTLPRKIKKPFYFSLQSNKAFNLCSAKFRKNHADLAPQNHRDIASGAKIITEGFFLKIYIYIYMKISIINLLSKQYFSKNNKMHQTRAHFCNAKEARAPLPRRSGIAYSPCSWKPLILW